MWVWLEVRFRISAWVLARELVWNVRVECAAHSVFVKSYSGWVHGGRVYRWEAIDAESRRHHRNCICIVHNLRNPRLPIRPVHARALLVLPLTIPVFSVARPASLAPAAALPGPRISFARPAPLAASTALLVLAVPLARSAPLTALTAPTALSPPPLPAVRSLVFAPPLAL